MKTFTKIFAIHTVALITMIQSCSNENVSKYSSTINDVDNVSKYSSITNDIDNNKYWKSRFEINLPDIYQGAQIQDVDTVDLNNDKLLDLILITGLGPHIISDNLSAPVKDAIVVYLQDSNGNYKLGNKEIFGKDIMSFGSSAGKKVFADFNNDNFIDIAYALHREDGRPGPVVNGVLTWGSTQQVIMSNGDGTYRIDVLSGPPLFQRGIAAVQISDNKTDLIYGNYPYPAIAYRYENNRWINLTNYPIISGVDMRGFKDILIDMDTHGNYEMPPTNGISYFKNNGTEWLKEDYVQLGIFETWVNEGSHTAYRYQNKLLINFHMVESCSLTLNDNSEVIIAKLESQVVPENYYGPLGAHYELEAFSFYTAFKIDKTGLTELDIIKGRFDKTHGVYFTCTDINADGFDDFVIHTKDAHSPKETFSVFINNLGEELVLTELSGLSEIGSLAPNAFFKDINNDGLGDIIIQDLANLKIYNGIKQQLSMEK